MLKEIGKGLMLPFVIRGWSLCFARRIMKIVNPWPKFLDLFREACRNLSSNGDFSTKSAYDPVERKWYDGIQSKELEMHLEEQTRLPESSSSSGGVYRTALHLNLTWPTEAFTSSVLATQCKQQPETVDHLAKGSSRTCSQGSNTCLGQIQNTKTQSVWAGPILS